MLQETLQLELHNLCLLFTKHFVHELTFQSLLVTWCTNRFNFQELYFLSTLFTYMYLSENKQRLVLLTA